MVQAAATTARASSTVHHRVDLRLVLIASLLLSSRRRPAPPASGHNRLLSRSCNLYEQSIVAADSSQYDRHPATDSQEVDIGPLRHQDTDSSHHVGQDARSVDSSRRHRGLRVGVELRSFLPDSRRHQWPLSGGMGDPLRPCPGDRTDPTGDDGVRDALSAPGGDCLDGLISGHRLQGASRAGLGGRLVPARSRCLRDGPGDGRRAHDPVRGGHRGHPSAPHRGDDRLRGQVLHHARGSERAEAGAEAQTADS